MSEAAVLEGRMHFAWLARNQLHVKTERGVDTLRSEFAENARRKAADSVQRNAWKTQNSGALFMGMGQRDAAALAHEVPAFMTGVSAAPGNSLLYSLELSEVAGVFETTRDGKDEKRLFHGNVGGLRDLTRHPQAAVCAATVSNLKAGTSHVALVGLDGEGVNVLTEGDTVERHPRWVPGQPSTVVFESAGVGRSPDGLFAGLGPSSVQSLDVKSGELKTLAELPDFDLCQPRVDAKGALYFVRRPWRAADAGPSLGQWLLGILLLPVRVVMAVFGWFNFFSMMYTGKPLLGGGNARSREADLRRMMLWGNMAQARQGALSQAQADELKAVRAPNDWVLCRRVDGKDEELLKGVATWDLSSDGSILFSDGVDISVRRPDGKTEKLHSDSAVQALVALS